MGEAFDAACKAFMYDRRPADVMKRVIARRIFAAAREGEGNFLKRRDAALKALPINVRARGSLALN